MKRVVNQMILMLLSLFILAGFTSCKNTTGTSGASNDSFFKSFMDEELDGIVSLKAPVGLFASKDNRDVVTISWSMVKDAAYYRVYRTESNDPDTPIEEWKFFDKRIVANEFTDTTAKVGVQYYYRVRAFSEEGGYSELSFPTRGYVLSAPININATKGTSETEVTVTWEPIPGAIYYKVLRSTTSDGNYAEVGQSVTEPVYPDLLEYGTVPNVKYYYKVVSYNAKKVASYKSVGYAEGFIKAASAPDAIMGVAASQGAFKDGIEISWKADGKAAYYTVWYANSLSDEPKQIPGSGDITAPKTSYLDRSSTIEDGVDRYYWVKGFSALNFEGPLSVKNAAGYRLGRPANLESFYESSGDGKGVITLRWSKVRGADKYIVRKFDGSDFVKMGEDIVSSEANITYTEPGVDENTVVKYQVFAVNSQAHENPDATGEDDKYIVEESFPSAINAWASLPPEGLDVSSNDRSIVGKIRVSWNKMDLADSYVVYRSEGKLVDWREGTFEPTSWVLLDDNVVGTQYVDDYSKLKIAWKYFYRIQAKEPSGGKTAFTSPEQGYRAITNKEFYALFQMNDDQGFPRTTVLPSVSALHVSQTIQGRISGSFLFKGDAASSSSATITTSNDNFKNYYFITNHEGWTGEFDTSESCPDLNGTSRVTGWFQGRLEHHIVITAQKSTGGYCMVTQGSETTRCSNTDNNYEGRREYAHLIATQVNW